MGVEGVRMGVSVCGNGSNGYNGGCSGCEGDREEVMQRFPSISNMATLQRKKNIYKNEK